MTSSSQRRVEASRAAIDADPSYVEDQRRLAVDLAYRDLIGKRRLHDAMEAWKKGRMN